MKFALASKRISYKIYYTANLFEIIVKYEKICKSPGTKHTFSLLYRNKLW